MINEDMLTVVAELKDRMRYRDPSPAQMAHKLHALCQMGIWMVERELERDDRMLAELTPAHTLGSTRIVPPVLNDVPTPGTRVVYEKSIEVGHADHPVPPKEPTDRRTREWKEWSQTWGGKEAVTQ